MTFALDMSIMSWISSPASKRRSNSALLFAVFFVFIYLNLLFPCPSDRNDADRFTADGVNCRPYLLLELADHDPSVLYGVWNMDFNPVFIQPQLFCRLKVNAVFRLV